MTLLSVIVILNLAGTAILAAQSVCQNPIYCPCGSTGKNLTVCLETNDKENELCKTWSKCKTCQDGLHKCLQCEEEFEGPLCSVPKRQALKSRQKRQFYYPVYGRVSKRPKNRLQKVPTRKSVTSKIHCHDPGQVANGNRMNSDGSPSVDVQQYEVGQSVVYTCNPGYALQNQTLITCLASGTWSSTIPYCSRVQSLSPIVQLAPERPRARLKYCSDLGVDPNGSRRPRLPPNSRGFLQGSRVEYFCNEGFDLNGDLEIFCLSSGKWSAGRPKCEEQFRTSDTDFRVGLKGPPELAYCPNPGTIPNGRFVYYPSITSRGRRAPPLNELNPEYPEGSRLQYSCDSGYALEGSASLTCESSGLWSAESPLCRRVIDSNTMYCDNPGKIFNGRMQPRRGPVRIADDDVDYPEGTQLEYSCDEGFILQGSSSLICQSTGFWSSDPPTCVGECGRSFTQTSRRLIRGKKTYSGEWPWIVAISDEWKNKSRVICAGAVLNSRTVLTAAHCVTARPSYNLYFGKRNRRKKEDDANVLVRRSSQIIIHPDFSDITFDSDIALVKIEPPIKFSARIQPVCLTSPDLTVRNVQSGNTGYVVGWGLTEEQLPADELLLVRLPVQTNEVCKETYRQQNITLKLTRNMFCAGDPDGLQSICKGNSGSPLVFYDNKSARYTVEGIVSFSTAGYCGQPGRRYTVFTKVFHFIPWILRNL